MAKETVKAKISNLPVVKIIQKALHQKFYVTWLFKMKKKDGHFKQILALLTLEQRIHSEENEIIPTS